MAKLTSHGTLDPINFLHYIYTNMDGQSINIRMEKFQQLKALFPEIFTENKIDLSRLKQVLGDDIFAAGEHYELSWAGKNEARQATQKQTTATLIHTDTLGLDKDAKMIRNKMPHILIEGENLEVLRVLQKSYFGKVKVIYIDPPYNTGNDSFIYPDDYTERQKIYQKRTGITDDQGFLNKQDLWQKNSKENGQFHSIWLSMMYPRLYLARNLMREDGVIFISIDDHEASNLKLLCDEIFGQENFVANVIWQKKYSPQNDAKWFSAMHDHIWVYAKNKEIWRPFLLDRTDAMNQRYCNPDNDPRGDWKSSDLSVKSYHQEYDYQITTPSGRIVNPPVSRCWRTSKDNFQELVADNRVWFGKNGDQIPSLKRFLAEVKKGMTPTTIWYRNEVGDNQEATKEIKELFDIVPFDTPKPSRLIKRILQLSTRSNENHLILDFFAGSGTTAQAVMELNEEDGGNRRFICVQIPELLDVKSDGYGTIFDITKARITKVIARIKEREKVNQNELELIQEKYEKLEEQLGEYIKNDQKTKKLVNELEKVGVRRELLRNKAEFYASLNHQCEVYQLAESNFQTWRSNIEGESAILAQLELLKNSEKRDSIPENLIVELLLKSGLELGITYEKTAGFYQFDKIWICLEKFTTEMKNAIIRDKPEKLICLNSCFIDDEILTNLELELMKNNIDLLIV